MLQFGAISDDEPRVANLVLLKPQLQTSLSTTYPTPLYSHYSLLKTNIQSNLLYSLPIVSPSLISMAGTGVFAEIFHEEVYKYYADGEWRKSTSGKSVSIINPTTRKVQFKVQGE